MPVPAMQYNHYWLLIYIFITLVCFTSTHRTSDLCTGMHNRKISFYISFFSVVRVYFSWPEKTDLQDSVYISETVCHFAFVIAQQSSILLAIYRYWVYFALLCNEILFKDCWCKKHDPISDNRLLLNVITLRMISLSGNRNLSHVKNTRMFREGLVSSLTSFFNCSSIFSVVYKDIHRGYQCSW